MNPIKIWQAVFHANFITIGFVFLFIVILGFVTGLLLSMKKTWLGSILSILVFLLFGLVIIAFSKYSVSVHLYVFILPSLIITFITWLIFNQVTDVEEEENPHDITYTALKGTVQAVANAVRSIIVLGSAGAGKTVTVIFPAFIRVIKNNLASVIYDHKSGELTKFFLWFYKKFNATQTLGIFAPHDLDISVSINPIAPRYIRRTEDIIAMNNVMFDNLSSDPNDSKTQFYRDAASGLFSALAYRVKEENPSKCTVPHIASFIFQSSDEQLIASVDSNIQSRILATEFLDGMGNDRLAANIKATIGNAIKKICTPNVFAVLEKDEFDLHINKPDKPSILLQMNETGYESFWNPIHSFVFESCKTQFAKLKQHPTLIILDEAGMIRWNNLWNIPALLRSFNIGVIIGMQDLAQGLLLYTKAQLDALTGNLNTWFFGRANNNTTSKAYEEMFGYVKEATKSVSRKKGSIFDTSSSSRTETTGEKEVKEYRADSFRKLSKGEFHCITDSGDHHFHQWDYEEHGELEPERIKNWTESELKNNFERIVREGKHLFIPETK